jgi:menaquinone-dependent protoporphyrinogen oxidase
MPEALDVAAFGLRAPLDRISCVLVAHPSRYGSTAGITERIATTLRARGTSVDLRPVAQVDGVEHHDGIVLGSAVFNQAWPSEADAFACRSRDAQSARPVRLFSGGTFADPKRFICRLMTREPRNIRALLRARPCGHRVCGRAINRRQRPHSSRAFYHALGGGLRDSRDRPEIGAWTHEIARALENRAPLRAQADWPSVRQS